MTLRRIYENRVFDDATTDARRTRVYVRSGELGFHAEERPEAQLMRALVDDEAPQRCHVVGPSGAGKTSLILRVLVDLAKRDLDARREVLVLRVGDQPQNLESAEAVMKFVLETIRIEGYRFSNVDYAALEAASADERIATDPQLEHRGTVSGPLVGYSASMKAAFDTRSFGQNAAQIRHDLEHVLGLIADSGYRPVLVLDDTEKFVSAEPGGTTDVNSIENLYHHGVRSLAEMPADLVVAMHPRFEDVAHVKEVTERFGVSRIDVPLLPAHADEPVLSRILERRMQSDGLTIALESVIEPAAVEDLQVLYHERDSNLRSILHLAHDAAGRALESGSDVVQARHVRQVVAQASE